MIGTLKGMRMISEPFNLRSRPISEGLGLHTWSDLLGESSRIKHAAFLKRIQRNELRFLNPNPFVQGRFFTTRTLYKVIHLPPHIAAELCAVLGGKFLCLMRHPIPVSLSREVFPILDDFGNSSYRERFSEDQLLLADRIIASGSHLENGALAWCLHFVPYLRENASDPSAPIITYEACVAETENTIDRIQRFLKEEFPERARRRALTPSRVLSKSDPQTQAVLRGRNGGKERVAHLVGRWQNSISEEDRNAVQAVLDAFGVTFYRVDHPFPQEKHG